MKNNPDYLLFRKSHIVLILRLIALEVFLVITYLLVRIPESIILPSFFDIADDQFLNISAVLYFVTLTIFELVLVLRIALDWSNEEFEIKEESLVHRSGIFNLKQKTYTLRNLGSAHIYQGFLGKLLNYGTIVVSSPILKGDIILADIHDPHKILALLEDNIDHSNVKHAEIIRSR